MICEKCGREFTGNFCPTCGKSYASNDRFKPLLADQSEEIKAVLGNNYAQSFLSTGMLQNGFSILTNKRVYFKGKCLVRKGKGFYTNTEERIVDLKDVTGTGYLHKSAIWAKLLQFFFVFASLVGPIVTLSIVHDHDFVGPIILCGILCFALSLLFRAIHKILSSSIFEISYAGGGIAFRLHWITVAEAKEFQKQLILLKQAKQEQAFPEATPVNPNGDSVAQQLQSLFELLKSGAITQEEFEALKKEILS